MSPLPKSLHDHDYLWTSSDSPVVSGPHHPHRNLNEKVPEPVHKGTEDLEAAETATTEKSRVGEEEQLKPAMAGTSSFFSRPFLQVDAGEEQGKTPVEETVRDDEEEHDLEIIMEKTRQQFSDERAIEVIELDDDSDEEEEQHEVKIEVKTKTSCDNLVDV